MKYNKNFYLKIMHKFKINNIKFNNKNHKINKMN